MNYLIAAGATREYIDPIRFISNPSSGRMGMAVAEAAKERGHNVILIMAHCSILPPKEIPLVRVTTAAQMRKAIKQYVDWADILVMAAAVGDWKAAHRSRQKIKREAKTLTVKLTANPDILAEVGRLKKRGKKIFLVGFSLDTGSLIENAKKKLQKKGIDLIIANPPDTFGESVSRVAIVDKRGEVIQLPLLPKKRLAGKLVRMVERYSSSEK